MVPNAQVLEQKKQIVAEVAEKLQTCASSVLTDYRGLNVAQVTELRRRLREAGIEFKVIKNTMTRRAAEQANFGGLQEYLTGPTAIAFSREDAVAPAKILSEFAKENDALKIKAGIVEGKIVSADEIKALASLPSREGLLSMLLSVLQAPVRNFALAVKAVAEQKEQAAQA